MPREIEGYDFVESISITELCNYFVDSENPYDQWVDENVTGSVDITDGLCIAVGAVTSLPTVGIGGALAFVVCEGGKEIGCAIEDMLVRLGSCDELVINVYIADINTEDPIPDDGQVVQLWVDCAGGDVTTDKLVNVAESAAADGVEIAVDILDDASEIGDNLIDSGASLLDQSSSLI